MLRVRFGDVWGGGGKDGSFQSPPDNSNSFLKLRKRTPNPPIVPRKSVKVPEFTREEFERQVAHSNRFTIIVS